MRHDDSLKSVRDYFSDDARFEMPCYQRGYKWSLLEHRGEGKTHLEKLFADLKDSFTRDPKKDYYLQGVTVRRTDASSDSRLELVDGQQRTTSLFLVLLWAKINQCGGDCISSLIRAEANGDKMRLFYGVRQNVNEWIEQRERGDTPVPDFSDQDLCAFEKAWETIEQELRQYPAPGDEVLFINFILDHVKLIYVVLHTEQPTKVFSMMNQDKADMTRTDLVKAMLLSEASRQAFQDFAQDGPASDEWQINHLRSHLAREWDAWRKWWEDHEHSKFWRKAIEPFPGEPPLSGLLRLYWLRKVQIPAFQTQIKRKLPTRYTGKPEADFLFAAFGVFIQKSDDPNTCSQGALETFEELRELQHILQEWFESPEIYNWLGLLFNGTSYRNEKEAVLFLLEKYASQKAGFCEECLKPFYLAASLYELFVTDSGELPNPTALFPLFMNANTREEAVKRLLSLFQDHDVYHSTYEVAAQQLLRCNVQRLTPFDLKFDFNMYESPADREKRSLEHIHPQSMFLETPEGDIQATKEGPTTIGSRLGNSIGNLVLVPKGLNSSLSDKPFREKRIVVQKALLRPEAKADMALWLHSLEIFIGHQKWGVPEIEDNGKDFLEDIQNAYRGTGDRS